LGKKIQTAGIQARKVYLNAVISEICVGDDMIQIIEDKTSFAVDLSLAGRGRDG
jgi:hypothetical protein